MKSEMPKRKPWFLKEKKRLGDWSHLRRKDLNELLAKTSVALSEAHDKGGRFTGRKVKETVLEALCEVAHAHRCIPKLGKEGGDICFYYHHEPVFAFRIGTYSDPAVEPLLKGKALYRGIIDVLDNRERTIVLHENVLRFFPGKVFYYMLPVYGASKWRSREAKDMLRIIECLKEHPGYPGRDIRAFVHLNTNKLCRLLSWLEARRIIYRRGRSSSSGFYLNRRPTRLSSSDDSGSDFGSNSSSSSSSDAGEN